MCGIAGIWRGAGSSDDRAVVASMLEPLRTRGPDGHGLVQEGPLTLGHQRLAILDLTAAASQPMRSRSGRFVISYNGEIYNFADLRAELGLHPSRLRSAGDTEVLLEAWERWGPDCLRRLVGPFAFSAYDLRERRLYLVRDRVGERPLFYHHQDGVLAFASRTQALFRVPWIHPELDEDALAEYLTLRYVVAPRTVASGVQKVRPGHFLEVDGSGSRTRRWWTPPFATRADTKAPLGEAVERFDHLFRQACRRTLVSDVPVGMLLSDGIDSNAVRVAVAGEGANLPAFTFQAASSGPPELTSPDASHTSGSIDVYTYSSEELHRNLESALSSLTEPVGDGSLIATWSLLRDARNVAGVFLCGHGGDEVLGGYRLSQERFRLSVLRWMCRLPLALSAPIVDYWTHGAEPVADRRRAFAGSRKGNWPAAVPYLIHRPLYFADVQHLFGGACPPERFLSAVTRLYAEFPEHYEDLDRMQYVLLEGFFAANILSFSDSVSMDSSVELRMPFVDRDLLEYVLGLPRGLRVGRWPGSANTKLLLRHWARELLPRDLIERKKRTFSYGSIRHLIRARGSCVRDRILDNGALRRRLPGLESWVSNDVEFFHRSREGTLWALLALAVWADGAGVR